jgi:hypothetical protein
MMARQQFPRGAMRYATAVLTSSRFFFAFAKIFHSDPARVDPALIGVTPMETALFCCPRLALTV